MLGKRKRESLTDYDNAKVQKIASLAPWELSGYARYDRTPYIDRGTGHNPPSKSI